MEKIKTIYLPALLTASGIAFFGVESIGYGDSPYYAADIENGSFIEPGHLLWRPLGGLVYWIAQAAGYTGDALWIIQGLSLMASVASVGAMFLFISRWCSPTAALWGAALFAFSHGFWLHGFSGCSYTLSVLFTILAFIFATPASSHAVQTASRALLSGILGGLASLTWLLQGLNFPALLLANILFCGSSGRDRSRQTVIPLAIFVAAYGVTSGLPLVGAYLYSAASSPGLGYLGWLSSSSHGITKTFDGFQIMRVGLGFAQSIVSVGNLGRVVRLWLTDDIPGAYWTISKGLVILALFYGFLGGVIWLLWQKIWGVLSVGQKKIFLVGICSLLANVVFALSWDATSLERYFPSVQFLILGICFVFEWTRTKGAGRKAYGMLPGVVAIGVVILFNWFGTFQHVLAGGSVKQQWLVEVERHLKKEDLLIVIKNNVTAPHNHNMPKVLSLSIQLTLMSNPEEWKPLTTRWIRETWARGGRVLIGESVLGLDSRPRYGWSFTEHPVPSPKDLDEFFAPLKGELLFSISGERVWVAKPLSQMEITALDESYSPFKYGILSANELLVTSPHMVRSTVPKKTEQVRKRARYHQETSAS